MGFKAPKRTATIRFDEDSPYFGAEIEMRLNVPMWAVFELQRANAETTDQPQLLRTIGDLALVKWNVEDDDDNPIPANGDGLLMQPPDFIWGILGAWQEAMTTPSVPLEQPSKSGDSSVGELIATGSP